METAVQQFDAGITGFREMLDTLAASIKQEREALQLERDRLNTQRREFEEEQAVVAQVAARASEQVTLNVGGARFMTTVSTLRHAPPNSLFSAMFSGRHTLAPDESGCFFLDRDGRHFHDVLNFLRDGTFSCPEDGADHKYLLELRKEAEYYCLAGLVDQIDRHPYGMVVVQRAGCIDFSEAWVYSEESNPRPTPDEVVLSVSAPCQLMGVGLCGTKGLFTVSLEVTEVDPNDFSWNVNTATGGCLASCVQSFTKADEHKMLLPRPVPLLPDVTYKISAAIKGAQSFCCDNCFDRAAVEGVKFTFHVWESPNGTNESRGQFPVLYFRLLPSTAAAGAPVPGRASGTQ